MNKKRIDFSKNKNKPIYFDFLYGQIKSYHSFISIKNFNKKKDKLYKLLKTFFPIINKLNNLKVDFVNYYVSLPKFSVDDCIKYGLTYSIKINIKLKISFLINTTEIKINKIFYLCSCPYITNSGSFIINGNPRAVIYQFNKSPGAFFGEMYDYTGNKQYYVRIIPITGVWIEFIIDKNNVIYTCIDKKKKVLAITFFKALGLYKKDDIYEIFGIYEKIKLNKKNIKNFIGRKTAKNIYKKNILLFKKKTVLKKEDLKLLLKNNILYLYLYNKKYNIFIYKILKINIKKNDNKKHNVCNINIYRLYNRTIPPNLSISKKFIKNKFFNKQYYNLGEIGRHKINLKLNSSSNINNFFLTKEDYKNIIRCLIGLLKNKSEVDDIDDLSNRQVKTIGDHLSYIFSNGLFRIKKIINNIINTKIYDYTRISRLINSRVLNSLINSFFATSQVSQFLDQTNPLSEITHKRRITLLGPGGITKSRASFEARDVNYSHYGRLCPIETPEGPNIGLIYSLSLFSNINKYGFLETPYKKINNGIIDKKIYFLTSEEERDINIGSKDVLLNYKSQDKFLVRRNTKIVYKNLKHINYIDYSPDQILSISASLIPFLEHNDVNRALMGSNMMRQSVPLLFPDEPIVGTGIENKVVYYSRNYINAKNDGIVKYVDGGKIVVKYKYSKIIKHTSFGKSTYTHKLSKFKKTNQNTCFNLNPIVKKGERIKKNQILCEGFATKNKLLSLGKNILVAFMSWKGYNYEDSIIVSDRVLKNDMFTSLHIEIFTSSIKKIKYGKERFTRDIPNITKSMYKKLDRRGIIKVGSKVCPGDILVGKVKSEKKKYVTPEEKLLKYIFGNKTTKEKDISLRAPSYLYGTVLKVKVYRRKRKNYLKKILKIRRKYYKNEKKLKKILIIKLFKLLKNYRLNKSLKVYVYKKKSIVAVLYKAKTKINITILIYLFKNKIIYKYLTIPSKIKKLINLIIKNFNIKANLLKNNIDREKINKLSFILNNLVEKIKIYIIQKRKLKVGDKMSGRHGNKGVVAKIVKEVNMPFLEDGTTIDMILNPLSVPSRMNLGQVLEAILGYIGMKTNQKYYTPNFDGCNIKTLNKLLKKNKIKDFCKFNLYDGITGEKYHNKVTVGVIYMLKLGHMVDDKLHTRSTGPYSLITQQPLGGKAQSGGQRLGEMEVWALEAFGVSNILRELLTIKSDDIKGRVKVYESIVKGKELPNPNIPESFNVLTKELKGLCLNLKIKKNVKTKNR